MDGEYPFCIFIDIGGGTKHNKFYKVLNNMECLDLKMGAIKNCIDIGIKSMAITAIIARGLNEEVIPEMLEMADRTPEIQSIHFRNVSKMGTWGPFDTQEPYSIEELKDMVKKYIPDLESCKPTPGFVAPEGEECHGCCHRFIHNHVSIELIDFASEISSKCWKRGTDYNIDHVMTYFEKVRQDG